MKSIKYAAARRRAGRINFDIDDDVVSVQTDWQPRSGTGRDGRLLIDMYRTRCALPPRVRSLKGSANKPVNPSRGNIHWKRLLKAQSVVSFALLIDRSFVDLLCQGVYTLETSGAVEHLLLFLLCLWGEVRR